MFEILERILPHLITADDWRTIAWWAAVIGGACVVIAASIWVLVGDTWG